MSGGTKGGEVKEPKEKKNLEKRDSDFEELEIYKLAREIRKKFYRR